MPRRLNPVEVAWRQVVRSKTVAGLILVAVALLARSLPPSIAALIPADLGTTIADDFAVWLEAAGMGLIGWGRATAKGPLVRRRQS